MGLLYRYDGNFRKFQNQIQDFELAIIIPYHMNGLIISIVSDQSCNTHMMHKSNFPTIFVLTNLGMRTRLLTLYKCGRRVLEYQIIKRNHSLPKKWGY